jgi:multidrug efflux system membrane fusion protein
MGSNFAPAPQAPPETPSRPGPAAKPRKSHGWLWFLILAALGIAGYRYYPQLQSVSKASNKADAPPPKKGGGTVPVVAATARRGELGIYLTGLGSAAAYNTVTIRSRVDGELMRVAFTEGQLVQKDDLLAEIDPRPFQAQLVQAEGQLARDTAQLENARVDQRRYEVLSSQGVISRQQFETQTASVHQYEGAIRADEGMIQNIKLQLTYCRILSPLTGRLGLRLVDQGNIIHANDPNGMATITQLQPIAVLFNLAQDYLPQILKKLKAGETLPVEAWDRDLKQRIEVGKLLTIDNAIDPGTGTARFKAEFPNDDNALFPNQFVNARLLIDTRRGVVIVPAPAIQRSPQSAFVYVVKDDQTVEMRNIVAGPVEGDDAVIESGLAPGEIVVIDGVDKLQQGTKVESRGAGPGTGGKSGKQTGKKKS